MHYRIVTNKVLKDMLIAESSACPHCNEDPETIVHAFIEYPNCIRIWKDVEYWVKKKLFKYTKISV